MMLLVFCVRYDMLVSWTVPAAPKTDEITTETNFRFPKISLKTRFFHDFPGPRKHHDTDPI